MHVVPEGRLRAFRLGDWFVQPAQCRLSKDGQTRQVRPKVMDLLTYLAANAGEVVSKDQLLTDVWKSEAVSESALTRTVTELRQALGDAAHEPRLLETIPKRGYRLIGPVSIDSSDIAEIAPRLAAQADVGSGPTLGDAAIAPAQRTDPEGDDSRALRPRARPVELYQWVGRGRSHLLSASYFELSDSVTAFRAAIESDSTYAPAHAGLARARCAQAELRTVPHLEAFAEAKVSALRALAMDNASVDAQVALGTVLFLSEWDWRAAERSLRRALTLDPAHTEGLVQYGSLMEALGKLDEGLQFKQQALARNPQSPWVLLQIAMSYWHQRKYDDTLVWTQRTLDVDPKHMLAVRLLRGVHWKRGDFESFLEENLRRATLFAVPAEALKHVNQICAEMREVYASAGRCGLAQYLADAVEDPRLEFDPMLKLASRRAVVYGDAGRFNEAFNCLDQAIALHDPALVYLAVAPQWDSLRGDPRFTERLTQLALGAAV